MQHLLSPSQLLSSWEFESLSYLNVTTSSTFNVLTTCMTTLHHYSLHTLRLRNASDQNVLSDCFDLLKYYKGKVLPYSLPSVWPVADLGVQAVSPQVT